MATTESKGEGSLQLSVAQPDPLELLDWTVRIMVIATEIVTMEDPQAICLRVKDALVEELGVPAVSILLADASGSLAYMADHGVSGEVKALGFREDGTAYTAFKSGQALYVEKAATDPRVNPGSRELLGAYAALPIHHRGISYGVMMVTFTGGHAFPVIERVTLTAFAHQMAIALDNGRLHRQERQRIAFLSAQSDLSAALSRTLKRNEMARILGETVQRSALSKAVAVWTEQDAQLNLAFFSGGETARHSLPAAESKVLAALEGDLLAEVPLSCMGADLGAAGPLPGGDHLLFAMPLQDGGRLEGLLAFSTRTSVDLALLQSMGEIAAMSLRNARLHEDSLAAANLDPLTGLFNRRGFTCAAHILLDEAARRGASVSVIMVDADHFKRWNDTYGHPVGDRVLVFLAQIIRAQVRPSDLVGRLGGEEFAVALQGVSEETAFCVAERIRKGMEGAQLVLGDGRSIPLPTLSLGTADLASVPERTMQRLLETADLALYRAKREGRNRTCTSCER